jgi:hypothetical protein
MKCLQVMQKGRFGNAIFRYLASRLFCIFLDYNISDTNNIQYYQNLSDEIFIDWMKHFLKEKTIRYYDCNYLFFTGFYQHDMIYRFFKKNLIHYIKEHPNDKIETDRNEIYYANDILGEKPIISFEYKTVIHLRIEDFIDLNLAMDPTSLDPVLERCEQPFLFVHAPVSSELDKKYIDYFKNKYPNSYYYTEYVVKCYNLMRHAEVLVCSSSTISWVAALFNDVNVKTYMPRNYRSLPHESFQYPNEHTEIYEWKLLEKENL